MNSTIVKAIESAIRTDPAGRGLLGRAEDRAGWRRGALEPAARSLAEGTGEVAIVTGFAIPMPTGPVAETDGPPGAVLLADVLSSLGRSVCLVTDEPCAAVVQRAVECVEIPGVPLEVCPVDADEAEDWIMGFLARRSLSHLVAIERVGPGHTPASLARQRRSGETPDSAFRERVPNEHFGRCHNMRGEIIDAFTAPLHRLFERAASLPVPPVTIGIGDGGNEIGMGALPWEEIVSRLSGPHSGWIPCATATDWTIVAGVSNWGAQAVAALAALGTGKVELIRRWNEASQQALLEEIVRSGPAVDGAKRLYQSTVDGLPAEVYFKPWRIIESLIDN